MIKVNIYRNDKNQIVRFQLEGHADFDEEGSDIVCSAVTVLVFNTINCIEAFTDEPFQCDTDEKNGGFLSYVLTELEEENHDTQLLLKTMVHGLCEIEKEYSDYISVKNREV